MPVAAGMARILSLPPSLSPQLNVTPLMSRRRRLAPTGGLRGALTAAGRVTVLVYSDLLAAR